MADLGRLFDVPGFRDRLVPAIGALVAAVGPLTRVGLADRILFPTVASVSTFVGPGASASAFEAGARFSLRMFGTYGRCFVFRYSRACSMLGSWWR